MLKRTKGLLLLSLLVITGLAGALNDTAISSKERKLSASLMKDTKNDLIPSTALIPSLRFHHSGGKHTRALTIIRKDR